MIDRATLSDALARVGNGSQSALAEVYENTSAKLFGICLRILGDIGEAEDALQEIYINVWRNAGRFDPQQASPITWLAALARNRAIDRLRSGRRHDHGSIDGAAEVADPARGADASIEEKQAATMLAVCIDKLEGRQAQAIRTAFFDGATYGQLAERQGVPLGTMKSWVRRGLLQLKACLQQ